MSRLSDIFNLPTGEGPRSKGSPDAPQDPEEFYTEGPPLVLPGGRGWMDHGVEQRGTPDLEDQELDGMVPVDVIPEPDEPEPVPVRIVAQGGREVAMFRAVQFLIPPGQPVIILNRRQDGARKTARVKIGPAPNGGADGIRTGWVTMIPRTGVLGSMAQFQGSNFPVPVGATLTIHKRVFAPPAVGTVQVQVYDLMTGVPGVGAGLQNQIIASDTTGTTTTYVRDTRAVTSGVAQPFFIGSGDLAGADLELNAYVNPPTGYLQDADTYIGSDQGVSPSYGYKLSNGDTVDIPSTEEVWAYSRNGAMAYVLSAYGQELH